MDWTESKASGKELGQLIEGLQKYFFYLLSMDQGRYDTTLSQESDLSQRSVLTRGLIPLNEPLLLLQNFQIDFQ